MEVVELGVCSIKNLLCMKGECDECVGSKTVDKVCEAIENCNLISFVKWTSANNRVKQVTQQASGEEVGEMFHEMAHGKKMRMHKYNMYRQYSELKFLKKNLKKEEVILSVDFSKNYDNKQRHEIRVLILAMNVLQYSQLLVISTTVSKLKESLQQMKKVD